MVDDLNIFIVHFFFFLIFVKTSEAPCILFFQKCSLLLKKILRPQAVAFNSKLFLPPSAARKFGFLKAFIPKKAQKFPPAARHNAQGVINRIFVFSGIPPNLEGV